MVRLFSEENKQKFQNILKQINWKKELSGKITDEAMQIFYKELSIAYNKAFPYVRYFLSKHKILYKFQFDSRKNHATTHALIDVMDYIYKSLDEGKFVIGIFIDFKKAFDTMKHDILLDKLEHYGITGITLVVQIIFRK